MMVPCFPVLRFPPLHFGPSFSTPFKTVPRFPPLHFDGPEFSSPAFSVAPLEPKYLGGPGQHLGGPVPPRPQRRTAPGDNVVSVWCGYRTTEVVTTMPSAPPNSASYPLHSSVVQQLMLTPYITVDQRQQTALAIYLFMV